MRTTVNAIEIPINVVGSSTFGRYPKISSEKTYNMFISDGWLVPNAGYQKVLELVPAGRGRGLFNSLRGGFMIAVVNSVVYRIDNNLQVTFIGAILSNTGEVSIDENLATQICIVDGVDIWIYQWHLPPNLTKQTGGVIGSNLIPNYVCFHNQYFLFGNGAHGKTGSDWYAFSPSGGTDPTTITLASTQTLINKPDYALAVRRIPGQSNNVLVFGSGSCQIFTQVPTIQTYQSNQSISIDYGCVSVDTIATSDKYLAWLGVNESDSPVIMVFSGQSATPISTDGIDYVLGTIKHPDKSTALFYRQDGHLFYQLTFYDPEDNLTLAYDFKTEKFFHLSDENLDYHPARQLVYFNLKTYFISLNNGCLYLSDTDITNYNENLYESPDSIPQPFPEDQRLLYDIPRIRICASVRSPRSTPFIANTVVITLEQGCDNLPAENPCLTLLIAEDGTRLASEDLAQLVAEHGGPEDCQSVPYRSRIDLSLSKDGGETYSNTVGKELNAVGIRRNILKWERMGLANDFIPKFRFWGLGRFVVWDGVLDAIPVGGQWGPST